MLVHPMWNTDTKRMLTSYSIFVAAVLLFTLLFAPSRAFAATMQNQIPLKAAVPMSWSCGTPNSNHCYGANFWNGANGADTRITLNTSLSGGGTQNDYNSQSFVTTEMWIETSQSTYWVEVGIISQYSYFGKTYPYYFWADSRPNGGGFTFHWFFPIPSDAETPLFRITRNGSSDWNVLVQDNHDSFNATSTANDFSPGYIQLGTELYNNYQTAYEPTIQYSNNRWLDNNGSWHYQGNDGVGTNIKSPVTAGWYNGQDPLHNSTGGIWYSCIPGYGC